MFFRNRVQAQVQVVKEMSRPPTTPAQQHKSSRQPPRVPDIK